MRDYKQHIIDTGFVLRDALQRINDFPSNETLTLFILNSEKQLVGTLTDGDVRRALLSGTTLDDNVQDGMNRTFHYLFDRNFAFDKIEELRSLNIKLIPILNSNHEIVKIIDMSDKASILPIEAIIMAGGEGKRLRPLTEKTPKPLLYVGEKPIIEHNIDRLAKFGIINFHISVNYLSDQISDYFGTGEQRDIAIEYIYETKPLGTIGAVRNIEQVESDLFLLMNSDILTDMDYEDFYKEFVRNEADMAIATIPYEVKIPYAVLETENLRISSFKEKPTYTYYSNAGIYLIKSEFIERIPKNTMYNTTDLMEDLIALGKNVISYPIRQYWLDIGKHEDYTKAQEDIKHLKL